MQNSYFKKYLAWTLLMTLSAELVPVNANAAFEQPTTWSDMSDLDLRSTLNSQYGSNENLLEPNISFSSLQIALSDADSLIRPEFRIPKGLLEPVRFWLRVYTEFTTRHVVVFDSRHPEVIYEVLDFRDLAKTARGPIAYELTAEKRVKAAMTEYRKALHYLAKHPNAKAMPNGRAREIQAIRKATTRLRHGHSFSELALHVRSQTGQRDNIVKGLLAAEAFLPKMEQIFRQIGVPVELTRLPLVESSFNLHAKSRVGAAGVWQFMRNPGVKFLRIEPGSQIDERLSPLKATAAAAHMIKESYQRFKNWPLTVTSYNHGLRGLPRGKKEDADNFGKIAHFFDPCKPSTPLGWAGRNYYAEFLAVLHAEAYRKMFYGEPPASSLKPIIYRKLEKPIQAMALAKASGISIGDFRFLNPDIQNLSKTLPRGFFVAVPAPTNEDDLDGVIKTGRRNTPVKKRIKLAKND